MALHVNYPLINQIFMNVFVHYKKFPGVNHKRTPPFVGSIFAVTSRADHVGRNYFLIPRGQDTPVPPRPQYPSGFLLRYCWW